MGGSETKGYVNPDLLWTPTELEARLGDPNLRVIDVRAGEAYAMGHIPGARHFPVYGVNTYDTDEAPLRSFVEMWAFLLSLRGVAADHTIAVYGELSGMKAARAYWFVEYLGHDGVHLLDGGFQGWVRAGLPVVRDAEPPAPTAFRYQAVPGRVATYRDVLAAIDDPERVILDTRSPEEFRGTDRRAKRGGAVPSAVPLDWVAHLTPEGEMKPADELRDLFEAIGVTPDKEVIAYCNTGYRSAHAYLALRLLGYPRVKNYVGSWQEWANRDELPVITPEG